MGKLSRLTVLALVFVAGAAFADKQTDEAKTRFKRGAEFYDEGNFRAALIEFERAYQLLPNYKLLYNIGQVHLQLLEYSKAQEAFVRYLKEGGPDVTGARRDEVNRELDRLKSRVGRIAITTNEGAEVLVDDESLGTAPLRAPAVVNTGRHTVSIVVPGRAPLSRVVDVAGLETTTVNLVAEDATTPSNSASAASNGRAAATPTVTRAGPPQAKSKTPFIVGWAVTGVLGLTGAIFAGLAFGAEGELQQLKGQLGVQQASLTAAAARVSGMSTAADILGLGALIAGGISVYLTVSYLLSDDVAVTVGPTGATFTAHF